MSNYNGGIRNRRIRVISRLKNQLESNAHIEKTQGLGFLSEKQLTRINKELAVLSQRTK